MVKELKPDSKKDHKSVSAKEYAQLLVEIKKHIKTAQVKAIFAVTEYSNGLKSVGSTVVCSRLRLNATMARFNTLPLWDVQCIR